LIIRFAVVGEHESSEMLVQRSCAMAPILGEIVGWEALLVLAVIALLFGGSRLPKLARSLGSVKPEFDRGRRDPAPPDPDRNVD
jgi:sec-independent protein translocase protein TatA